MSGKEYNPMKTKIKAVLFALFAAVMMAVPGGIAVAGDAEGRYTAFGVGLDSCAKYLKVKEYKEDNEDNWALLVYNGWINGFMSAAGTYQNTQKSFDVADAPNIRHFIREYCEKNPLVNLADAAAVVAERLIDRAGRR